MGCQFPPYREGVIRRETDTRKRGMDTVVFLGVTIITSPVGLVAAVGVGLLFH